MHSSMNFCETKLIYVAAAYKIKGNSREGRIQFIPNTLVGLHYCHHVHVSSVWTPDDLELLVVLGVTLLPPD